MSHLKQTVFNILSGTTSNPVNVFISILIILNVTFVVLGTVESIATKIKNFLDFFETFSVVTFTVEYILRIWSCTATKEYSYPFKGRVKYATKPLLIVDLLAILPYYLPMIFPIDLRFIRILRIFRVLRILKIERYSKALQMIIDVVKEKSSELISTFIVIFTLLVIVASFMYYVEPQNFNNIPSAMWWGVVTLTTVGYGDVYPVTPLGKIIGAILALLGIGLFGLPAGILASGFIEKIQKTKNK